ncbi:HNH endonuclease [Carex littledalei]|uniref:HNH endonuclease n=1 Tax=Carex littledalei TaxID=544730 RepID=A0A833V4A7_9POAL|nr:HNH endonuclease [Carex littledalei]
MASPPHPSPPRSRRSDKKTWGEEGVLEEREGEKGEGGRPRSFDVKTRAKCWQKAEVVAGRHPERWRKDPAGNVVCKRFWNCHGCLCYEYDHIIPFSKGGESTADNCQILQTRVNRLKSNKEWVNETELQGFSCDIKFTDKELDIIEMAVYGDVIRPGNQCRCRTVAEMLGQVKLKDKLAPCELPHKEPS